MQLFQNVPEIEIRNTVIDQYCRNFVNPDLMPGIQCETYDEWQDEFHSFDQKVSRWLMCIGEPTNE